MKTLVSSLLLAFSALCHAAEFKEIVTFGDILTEKTTKITVCPQCDAAYAGWVERKR